MNQLDELITRHCTFDDKDSSLLTELGLQSPNLDLWKETSLGQVLLPNNVTVTIYATSTPTLFFRFDLRFPDAREFRVETASGYFREYWQRARRFGETQIQMTTAVFEIKELDHEILERCARCNLTYRFKVTKQQAVDYLPPREKLIQHLFPEIPLAARAVLAKSHICGMCLYHDDLDQQEIAGAYVCHDAF